MLIGFAPAGTIYASTAQQGLGRFQSLMYVPASSIPRGVQLLHWDEVRSFLPLGRPIQIFDVGTGISFNVISMSNGLHADVEPATAADTAKLYEAFGAHTWNARPVWVTIGERTVAAAIHSMPHASDTVAGNDMVGHVCLHFYGSTTHNTREPVYHYTILEARAAYTHISQYLFGLPPISGTPASAATANVMVDGTPIAIPAYNIGGNNHIRLRDLAEAFNGTSAGFNIGWWGELVPGEAYERLGGELAVLQTGNVWARPTSVIFSDGWWWDDDGEEIAAFNVSGIIYFRLADLANLLNINVRWDGDVGATVVTVN